MKTAMLLLSLSLCLTACSTPKSVPAAAYTCKPWPEAPKGSYGYREIGSYIVTAKDAYNDCTAKLEALR